MNPYGYVGNNPETWNDPTGGMYVNPGGGGGGSSGSGGSSGGENCSCGGGTGRGSGIGSGQANTYNPLWWKLTVGNPFQNSDACYQIGCAIYAWRIVDEQIPVHTTSISYSSLMICLSSLSGPGMCLLVERPVKTSQTVMVQVQTLVPYVLCTIPFDCTSENGDGASTGDETGTTSGDLAGDRWYATDSTGDVTGPSPSSPDEQEAARNAQPNDVVSYRPTNPPYQNHHGVMDVWARSNIPGYETNEAPSVVLTSEAHNATRSVFALWRYERTGSVTGPIDWSQVSAPEIYALSEQMFDAAGVPFEARQAYYRALNQYIYSGSFAPFSFGSQS